MAVLTRYLRSLKWTPLPLGVGFAVVAATQYRHTRRREKALLGRSGAEICLAQPWEVKAYKLLPLRHFSRFWGWLNGLHLPEWSRSTVIGCYIKTFGCDITEAEEEDLNNYSSLSEFFKRSLKSDCRPVSLWSPVVSPVDGTVVEAGPVECGTLHQIKGVKYSMRKFLGPNVWSRPAPVVALHEDNDECFHASCVCNPSSNSLYQIVLYLAPGDYHRFHSPVDWKVSMRRHFPGELFSVSPSFASWIENLFILNERVTYVGSWSHGFFSMTAVGATNVGSVKVYFDDSLLTNHKKLSERTYYDKYFNRVAPNKCAFVKGAPFGEFNLGSTVVLVFEAPKGCRFEVMCGQKVKMGQALLQHPEEAPDHRLQSHSKSG